MKLATGTRLGPYQIQHAVGSGGMGVVYSADDARLGRKVAIKILPHSDAEHLKRFEREARMIGSLNHPNLLTLYDIGDHDGTPFLVTELLEGEPLNVRLGRGKLRIREAIQIGADVARGLAAAHEAGVVHRDIKPANIFLTSAGRTKILDFGVGKLLRTADTTATERDAASARTEATTDTGSMIGTPGYMAPEQLDGDAVDARTDIFALGVVLYEMITGVRAFASTSPIEESYAILKHTPEPPAGAPKALARVVLRCLEKRPEARFQSAIDLAFALDELDSMTNPIERISVSDLDGAPPQPARHVRRVRRLWVVLAVAGVSAALAAVVGIAVGRYTATSGGGAVAQRWPSLVEGGPSYHRVTYHSQSRWHARLSRDGKSALYSSYRDGRDQIMRSLLAQPSILPVNVDGRLLDISPHGELAVVVEAVFEEGGTLYRVLEGSGPRALTDHVTAATWLPDESLAIIRDDMAVEFPIGTRIVERKSGRLDLLRASPAGDRFAFVEHPTRNDTAGKVVVVDRTGKQLVSSSDQVGIEGAAWSPDGSELWFSNSATIYGLDMHGRERVVLHGAPGRLALLDVIASGAILVAPLDIRLKMFTGPRGGPYREVSWFDGSDGISVSLDGAAIAFFEGSGTGLVSDGYPMFLRRKDSSPTLFVHGFRFGLLPDASAAIVVGGPHKLTRVPTGIGTAAAISLGPIDQLDIGDAPAIAWQGRYAVVRGSEPQGEMKLWRIDLASPTSPPTQIAARHTGGKHPISPDGASVAIVAGAGGIQVVSMTGAPARSFAGPIGEEPLSFTGDGTAVFTTRINGDTIEVDRIDLAGGQRTDWLRIVPEQRPVYYSLALDATGHNVTYSTNSDASDLFVLEPPAAPHL